MSRTIKWNAPAQIVTGADVTIPVSSPGIASVLGAQILRPSNGVIDHTAALVIAAATDHDMADVALGVTVHLQAAVIAGVTTHTAADVATAMGLHTDVEVVAAIADHAVHAHDIIVAATGAPAEPFGASGAGAANIQSVTGQTLIGAAATGIQDNAAAQQHTVGATPLDHTGALALAHVAGADVGHVAGAAIVHAPGAVVEHLGADPIVPAVATKSTTRVVTLDVNLEIGDFLALTYQEVGERIAVT